MTESFSSLSIARKRISSIDDSLRAMRQEFHRQGIYSSIDWDLGSRAANAVLLSQSEFNNLRMRHQKPLNGLDALIGDLRTRLPNTASKPHEYTPPSIDPVEIGEDHIAIAIGVDPVVAKERAVTRAVIEEYFDIEGRHDNWPHFDHTGKLPLIGINSIHVAHKVLNILDTQPELLPERIALAPAKIRKTPIR